MKKQKIFGVSNREDFVEVILEKNKTYYPFLFDLLKKLNMEIPDLRDFIGNDPNILLEEDISTRYENDTTKIFEVVGKNRIFLIIITELRKELAKFLQENCKFIKPKKPKK